MKKHGAAIDGSGHTRSCVGVLEDDAAVREGLCLTLESMHMDVYGYASADEYFADAQGRNNCICLVLDIRLPGMSGLELQRQLLKQGPVPTIVFVTGVGDVSMAVEAMRNGAVDFLQKPFKEQQLLDSVHKALALARQLRKQRNVSEAVMARLACLTPKEREVLVKLIHGLRSKEIAAELGRATKTIEEHRAHIMRKMHASTIAELVSMCNMTQVSDSDFWLGPNFPCIPGIHGGSARI